MPRFMEKVAAAAGDAIEASQPGAGQQFLITCVNVPSGAVSGDDNLSAGAEKGKRDGRSW
jgi:hypothetical protein